MKDSNYTLMHKNKTVAHLCINETKGNISKISDLLSAEHLPIGVQHKNAVILCANLNEWFKERSIPASRHGIQKVLDTLNISTPQLILEHSFGLSLSDQYWIKPTNSTINWNDVNFFENDFSEDMGDLMFGNKNSNESLNLCSPDNTSDGQLKKRWKIVNGKRCLLKAGHDPFMQQPFNEVIASQLMSKLNIPHVTYELEWQNDEPYSICEDFITADTELVSAWQVMHSKMRSNNCSPYNHFVNICDENGIKNCKQALDEMFVLDYIIANEDRHFNNFGIIRDANTLEWTSMAPIFDSGSSLGYDKIAQRLHINIECRPFKSTHEEQLKLVSSFDWLDFSKLNSMTNEINDILSDEKVKTYIDDNRRNAIVNFVENRIQQLESVALSRNKTTTVEKTFLNDVNYCGASNPIERSASLGAIASDCNTTDIANKLSESSKPKTRYDE